MKERKKKKTKKTRAAANFKGRRRGCPAGRCFRRGPPKGQPLQLTKGVAGRSGRRKLCVTDWDGDGQADFLLNSSSANFLRQVGAKDGKWMFKDEGPLVKQNIEGHDVSPTTVDFDADGVPDFLGGAEDGKFYFLKNPRSATK